MAESPSPRRLAAVPAGPARAEPLPPERAPVPEEAPSLLAALDAGDDEAVRRWFRAHTPSPPSLAFYGLVLGAGVLGLMEWPAVTVAALGQLIIDRRFGGVEKVVADLRAQLDGRA